MKKNIVIPVVIFALIFINTAYPQAGQLDPTFGQDGIVTTSINVSGVNSEPFSTAIQSDGKIVAAGGTSNDFAVVRYNPNGTLDNSFGSNGIVTTDLGPGTYVAYGVAIQSIDGVEKIIAAGDGEDSMTVIRYNPNGSLDYSFGVNGIAKTKVGTSDNNLRAMTLQDDGKILVAGSYYDGADYDFTVIRYNPDGTLDNTFGQNGIVTAEINGYNEIVYSLAIQEDGKIVAAGYNTNGGDYEWVLVRYNPNGFLDNTFGTNGIISTQIRSSYDIALSVVIQSDGKIVAGGYSNNGVNNDFALARYNSNGNLDNTFGSNGIVIIGVNPQGTDRHNEIGSLVLQSEVSEEKIVAAGFSHNGTDFDFTLARLNTDGELDDTFGTNGILITPVGSSNEKVFSVVNHPEGKLIAAGSSYLVDHYQFALACYSSDGVLDDSFGTNGIASTEIGMTSSWLRSVAILSDGRIVAGGYSSDGNRNDFALTLCNPDGSPDNSFGEGGIVTVPISITDNDEINSIAVQSDDKIVAAGFVNNGMSYNDFVIARFNTDGSLDSSFGTNGDGFAITPFGSDNDHANSIAIQSDGKFVAAGTSFQGNYNVFALARYNPDGTLDNTFGFGGTITTPIPSTSVSLASIAIQGDGKIVATGFSSADNYPVGFITIRYNPDGTIDNTFGNFGIVTTQVGVLSGALSAAIQSDGKIITAGVSGTNLNNYNFTLVRYNPDGTLDNEFGTNGIVVTTVSFFSFAYSIIIQTDGKVIAAGLASDGSTMFNALARYNENGTLDSTFGTNGRVTTTIGSSEQVAIYSAAIQDDGNIVTGGVSGGSSYKVFTLARYLGGQTTGVEEEKHTELPSSFALEQNYPNPFNPVTVISYQLPVSGYVSLKVYDILGKEVANLVNENKQAGYYQTKFDGSSIASGMYIYRLSAENFISTKKMLMIK